MKKQVQLTVTITPRGSESRDDSDLLHFTGRDLISPLLAPGVGDRGWTIDGAAWTKGSVAHDGAGSQNTSTSSPVPDIENSESRSGWT
jgi:hypothetical protein